MKYRMGYLFSEFNGKKITKSKAEETASLPIEEILQHLQAVSNHRMDRSDSMIQIPLISINEWAAYISDVSAVDVIYSEEERQYLIYLMAYSEFEEYSVFHFQDFLRVSKGTVLSDIKKLRKKIEPSGILCNYSRKKGFYLSGDEFAIRRQAQNYLAELYSAVNGKFAVSFLLSEYQIELYAKIRDTLEQTIAQFSLRTVPGRVDEVTYFIGFSLRRIYKYPFERIKNEELISDLKMCSAVKFFLKSFLNQPYDINAKKEITFFTIFFLSVSEGEWEDVKLEFLFACSLEILHHMENYAAVNFKNFRDVLFNTFYHLVPAYFRISYGLYLPNIMIQKITEEYGELFEITHRALFPLEKIVETSIPDEEVGYFTILFGGAIFGSQEKDEIDSLRAVVVCPNGISSSLILLSELKRMLPTIDFQSANSVSEIDNLDKNSYDIIFSTVQMSNQKDVYLVSPLMSALEKNELMNTLQKRWFLPGFSFPNVKEIVDGLLPYITLKKGVSEEKLYRIINRKINHIHQVKEDGRPMLSELLTQDMIQLSDKKLNWTEAIALAAQPLIDNGAIQERYIDAMIDKVKEFGAFIHIGENIALPHARPEDGVNKLGMTLLKTSKPVLLLDDEKHPITIFICLAAVDNETHLRALASLTKILSDKEKLHALLKAESKEEIYQIIQKGED
ncbi:PTS sugar transporter subunit IIA [Enterococcus hirae]|nr:PTS sugar transporter subunit IIA [Enterococcus hirae]